MLKVPLTDSRRKGKMLGMIETVAAALLGALMGSLLGALVGVVIRRAKR
jgi:NhaP-type Na+/H+ or K+/H+ antiporter